MRAGGFIRSAVGLCGIAALAGFLCLPLAAAQPKATEPKPAVRPDAGAESVSALVRRLGDKSHIERQRAQRLLAEIGTPAKDALLAARNDADAEIRFRVRQLLKRVLDLDFERKLETFIISPDELGDDLLPGWRRYRELAGEDHAVRRLFVEMQRAERDFLAAAEASPEAAGELLELRCQQLQQAMQPTDFDEEEALTLGDIAALLFVAGKPDVTISSQAAAYVNNFSHQKPMQEAIGRGEYVEPLRALLGGWVGRRFEDNMVTYQNLHVALRYNLKQAVEPAAEMAVRKDAPANLRPYAILAVGKLGGKAQLPVLEPLLNDETEFTLHGRDNQVIRTQIRDVALAVMVHLTHQKLRDYGFDHFALNSLLLFNPGSLGFSKPEARDQALAKWRTWAESQR